MEQFISFIGLFTMVRIAFLLSKNKKKIDWSTVGSGIALRHWFAPNYSYLKPKHRRPKAT